MLEVDNQRSAILSTNGSIIINIQGTSGNGKMMKYGAHVTYSHQPHHLLCLRSAYWYEPHHRCLRMS